MKILSVPQIKEADQYTIENEPISSLQLMERAAFAIFEQLCKGINPDSEIHIFCGAGNNGGDGLVIARLLHGSSYNVTTWVAYGSIQPTNDNQTNLIALQNCKNVKINVVNKVSDISITESKNNIVIIDALFGSGLNRNLTGFWEELIYKINHIIGLKVAIDIPSGLFADVINNSKDAIFISDITYTIEAIKLTFLFQESASFVGEWHVVPIGLHPDYISNVAVKNYFTTPFQINSIFKSREVFTHKGSFGHALLIAGSYGMIGAAVLASKSCMRSGVGMITTHIPTCGYSILQTTVPEALIDIDESETHFSKIDVHSLEKYSAIGIGCGLSKHPDSVHGLKLLIQESKRPMVIDADALNILSENPTWLSFLPANSILTPHPKEFERLTSRVENSQERLELLRSFAIKHNVVILLKGAYTAIASPKGDLFFNSTGNSGMATAGSGDVLTGIILGLLAQGYTSLQTAILGVYLHGLSGDLAIEKTESTESLIASDLIDGLGLAFQEIKKIK
jgi:NAD(P)H-hydrate epimerase